MIKMNMETAGAVWVIVLATLVKSEYPMAPARLLFFVRFRYWLISCVTLHRREFKSLALLAEEIFFAASSLIHLALPGLLPITWECWQP